MCGLRKGGVLCLHSSEDLLQGVEVCDRAISFQYKIEAAALIVLCIARYEISGQRLGSLEFVSGVIMNSGAGDFHVRIL